MQWDPELNAAIALLEDCGVEADIHRYQQISAKMKTVQDKLMEVQKKEKKARKARQDWNREVTDLEQKQ
jgi:hypothetical protein